MCCEDTELVSHVSLVPGQQILLHCLQVESRLRAPPHWHDLKQIGTVKQPGVVLSDEATACRRSYLRVESSEALGARLQSEQQTPLGAMHGEGEVGEQAGLVLHKERRHSTAVLERHSLDPTFYHSAL